MKTRRDTATKPQRILLICPQPFLVNSGTPLSILIILQALTELGYAVDMVTTHIGEDREVDDVEIHRIPRIPFLRRMSSGPSIAKFLIMPSMFATSFSLLIRRDYDFIVSLEDGALYGRLFRRLFGKKHIAKIESLPTGRNLPGTLSHRMMGLYENVVFSGADVLLPLLAIEDEYVRSKTKDDQKTVVIEAMPAFREETVSIERVDQLRRQFLFEEGDIVILWIGNLAAYQGASLLRDTVVAMNGDREANATNNRCKFLVLGKDEETHRLFEGVSYDNLTLFEPAIQDMPNFVALGDVCLSFRNHDIGFPSKVLVFLRAGKPIVAVKTRSHGCHLTDGENSYLIDYDQGEAADAIRALASDEAERQRVGENARQYFERVFSWEKYRQGWKTAIGYVES